MKAEPQIGKKVSYNSTTEKQDISNKKVKIINNAIESASFVKKDSSEGACKRIYFNNASIHFYYQGYLYTIDNEQYDAFFAIARKVGGEYIYVFWKMTDFYSLVNCRISLETFLNNSCFITHNHYEVNNKDEFIAEILDAFFVKKIAWDFGL